MVRKRSYKWQKDGILNLLIGRVSPRGEHRDWFPSIPMGKAATKRDRRTGNRTSFRTADPHFVTHVEDGKLHRFLICFSNLRTRGWGWWVEVQIRSEVSGLWSERLWNRHPKKFTLRSLNRTLEMLFSVSRFASKLRCMKWRRASKIFDTYCSC